MQQLKIAINCGGPGIELVPQTLSAFTGDHIFWVNNDSDPHQPAALNPDGTSTPIVDEVPAGESSNIFSPSPLFDSSGQPTTYNIPYICAGVHGVIAVTPNP